jgi:glycosyltransferase involved in cell wall biosynthesis
MGRDKIINIYNRLIIRWMDWNIHNLKFDNPYDTKPILLLIISYYKKPVNNIEDLINNYELIILTNTNEEVKYYKNKYNCKVFFCNQNTFLDENLFKIDNTIKKKYDLVVNSAFDSRKNVNLVNKINKERVLLIGYFKNHIEDYVLPNVGTYVNFKNNILEKKNYFYLSSIEIVNYLNQCNIGGIFTKIEGACYASSEYLLCGLPVISTKSIGGRDIWYNENNSIICEDTNESVFNLFELALKKIEDGSFNPKKIRQDHIKLQDEFRNKLTKYIIIVLLNNNLRESSKNESKKIKLRSNISKIDFDKLKKELAN